MLLVEMLLVKWRLKLLALIVTVGWAIYPIGYAVSYLGGGADAATLNQIYNFADFVNKIAFGMAIYVAARSDS
jgi:bacteriorhodopsin